MPAPAYATTLRRRCCCRWPGQRSCACACVAAAAVVVHGGLFTGPAKTAARGGATRATVLGRQDALPPRGAPMAEEELGSIMVDAHAHAGAGLCVRSLLVSAVPVAASDASSFNIVKASGALISLISTSALPIRAVVVQNATRCGKLHDFTKNLRTASKPSSKTPSLLTCYPVCLL